jgi:hypothetical protein
LNKVSISHWIDLLQVIHLHNIFSSSWWLSWLIRFEIDDNAQFSAVVVLQNFKWTKLELIMCLYTTKYYKKILSKRHQIERRQVTTTFNSWKRFIDNNDSFIYYLHFIAWLSAMQFFFLVREIYHHHWTVWKRFKRSMIFFNLNVCLMNVNVVYLLIINIFAKIYFSWNIMIESWLKI